MPTSPRLEPASDEDAERSLSGLTHPTVEGLDAIFRPQCVAVVGASNRETSIGGRLLDNIVRGGFQGKAFAVHPSLRAVRGRPSYPRVSDIPGAVDLAILAVPAASVMEVVEDCGRKGVRGLVIVSAGFSEADEAGAALEARLRERVRSLGMRLIGPNGIGVLNADPRVRLNATFVPGELHDGPAAFMAQSGALGAAAIQLAAQQGLGIGRFASMGNKADVSGNDLLLQWEADPDVKLILMYLESFGNPRNFVRIARRVSRTKPVLAVKSGRSPAGARAARSHTGALAELDRFVDAMLDQCGVLRVGTVEELLQYGAALAGQPLPAGRRVGIVTNSGGPAILAVDALAPAGLELAHIGATTQEKCADLLPKAARFANPLDLLAQAGDREISAAVDSFLGDGGVDGVIVIVTPIFGDDTAVAGALAAVKRRHPTKPLFAVLFGSQLRSAGVRQLIDAGVPAYSFPESAVRSFSAMRRISEFRRRRRNRPRQVSSDQEAARRALDPQRAHADGWLRQRQAFALLEAYGIPVAHHAHAPTADDAAVAARWIGYPVVLKAEAAGLVHKSDVGGVVLGIEAEEPLRTAFEELRARVEGNDLSFEGATVMAQQPPARELLIGAVADRKFGPLLSFGLGGVDAEALGDVSFHLCPITDEEATRLVDSIRARALLRGSRGRPPIDRASLEDTLVRVARLAYEHPAIREVEMNPFMSYPAGGRSVAVDARVRIDVPGRKEAL